MAVRFDDRLLEEIKSRLRPSDVIGRTVKLRRQGREYVGLSPFTKEKTPSFYVNDDKGQFFDFSSGKNGDLITFLQETERLSFPEAVERLAAEAGVALPLFDPHGAQEDKKRQGLQDWLSSAASWFEGELRRPGGRDARAYLERRGLKEGDWTRFGLGYSPGDRTKLKDYLITKGAKPAELIESGLLIAPEDGGVAYDRFRERIIFPITDVRGKVVSFGGRALDPNAKAKYLNGPETPIFHKGKVLYGLAEARKLLHAGGKDAALVVVEGYMDVIACQRAGIAAVASMGTALTEDQMEVLWRLHSEPTLCFDSDAAGDRAVHRAIERALPQIRSGRSFKFALLTGGKDPDDVLRDQGAPALKSQLSQTISFAEALFNREFEAEPLDTPERRAGLKLRLRRAAAMIADRDLAEQYRRDLFDRFYALFQRKGPRPEHSVYDSLQGLRGLTDKSLAALLKQRVRSFNAAVALGAIEQPTWLLDYVDDFIKFGFGDKRLTDLESPILFAIQEERVTPELVMIHIRADGFISTYERAVKYAREVDCFPFINGSVPDPVAHDRWRACFGVMLKLAAIETELRERRQPMQDLKDGKIRHEALEPVANERIFVERGLLLRQEELDLARLIHSGALWDGSSLG
jgi:DNA primase